MTPGGTVDRFNVMQVIRRRSRIWIY